MSTQIRPQITPAPVRKSIHVNAPPELAFDTFANGIGRWWPKSHHICKAEFDHPVIEPREGGRWYELTADASECQIGKVLEWDPPSRLVLAWQLTPDWTYDPDLVTEVEVTFTPEAGGTRVNLEHRHLERMGEGAEEARESVDSPNGWGFILQLYSEQAK
jgi:uncharacterized protein YndB with AHSA1/START domain